VSHRLRAIFVPGKEDPRAHANTGIRNRQRQHGRDGPLTEDACALAAFRRLAHRIRHRRQAVILVPQFGRRQAAVAFPNREPGLPVPGRGRRLFGYGESKLAG
jgi:hypothetical protein